ncbi:MAG: hypothetical protein JWO58_3165 [Chitinophagaceae bacterium]|nr:hypothetical protein [Chitinophagaceae bacterium]
MNTTWSFSTSASTVNLLPSVILDKLMAIDPSSDQRFLPWLKKCFIQKPFDLKPDFTSVVNAVLRYIMSLPKKHPVELPERSNLEKWLVQMQLLEQKKYKGIPALKVIQPKGMNDIPVPVRKHIEEHETAAKQIIKEMQAGTFYVLTVEPKRWILVLLKQNKMLDAKLNLVDPQTFMEQWEKDLTERNEGLAALIKKAMPKLISTYVHGQYNFVEMEMYYDDFLNGYSLDYLAQDQHIVVHYFQSLQKRKQFQARVA